MNKEKSMKKEAGLWIDHRKAVIVVIVGQEEVTTTMIIGVNTSGGVGKSFCTLFSTGIGTFFSGGGSTIVEEVVVVTSQEVGHTKPSPEIFLEALRRATIKAGDTIFVGDQYRVDVLGSEAVGMHGILLDRGGFHRNIDSHPCIRNLNELSALIP